ncbi:MAG: hypothetical protein ICV68_13900, partial [Pyrinomonadaceae bacterium]|nr:hypothetical protein [Pyrinomonadaceae bacterium]
RLLTEDEFFDELLLGEEELTVDYVNDELTAADRLKFEQHFLSTPERQQKLRFRAGVQAVCVKSCGKG